MGDNKCFVQEIIHLVIFILLSFRQYMTERYSGQLQVLKMRQIFVILSIHVPP